MIRIFLEYLYSIKVFLRVLLNLVCRDDEIGGWRKEEKTQSKLGKTADSCKNTSRHSSKIKSVDSFCLMWLGF